ncbi:MAG TPA: hypothetical protein VMT51_02875 [Dongiaceae bacterium]|nr:hypothetical protein [Dongiaceae bacterium]
MLSTRRSLLFTFSAAAAACLAGARAVSPFAQDVSTSQGRQSPVRPGEDDPNPNPLAKSRTKALLDENQKDIKKNIQKLYDLAAQLKEEVEKTDATSVLSLAMVKKAEEIEKLARQIKERAKGG